MRPPGQAPKLGATNELYKRLVPERGLGGRLPGQSREIFDLAGPHQPLRDQRRLVDTCQRRHQFGIDLKKSCTA